MILSYNLTVYIRPWNYLESLKLTILTSFNLLDLYKLKKFHLLNQTTEVFKWKIKCIKF
jgi:hypothetical protein